MAINPAHLGGSAIMNHQLESIFFGLGSELVFSRQAVVVVVRMRA